MHAWLRSVGGSTHALSPKASVGEVLRGWDKDVKKGIWQGPVPRWTLYTLIMATAVMLVWKLRLGG